MRRRGRRSTYYGYTTSAILTTAIHTRHRVVKGGAVLLKAEAAEQRIDPGHAHLVRVGVRVRVWLGLWLGLGVRVRVRVRVRVGVGVRVRLGVRVKVRVRIRVRGLEGCHAHQLPGSDLADDILQLALSAGRG